MIRTYSRKLQACHYIAEATSLCRLCLERAEDGVPIFGDDPDSAFSSLALRVMICVGLEVKNEPCLPNLICLTCCKELEQYYAFRKKCEVSYQKLKSHLQAARMRQAMGTVDSENKVEDVDPNIINQSVVKDEKVNSSDFQPVTGESQSNCTNKMEIQAAPIASDVGQTSEKVEIEAIECEEVKNPCPVMEPEQLSSMIASVLLKLGVLGQQDGLLARLTGTSHIQLETEDGGVIQMELKEEEDVGAPREQEQGSTLAPAPREPAAKGHKNGVCGALASAGALRRHACPDCGRRFAQRDVMRRHRLVHAAVRPHPCPQCPKSFTQRAALAQHARAHLAPHERPLALHGCPHCPKLFLYASGLSRHMSAHSGRVFECGACGRQFADRSSARRHLRRAAHAPADTDTGAGDDTNSTTVKNI